ncbi:MAG: chalcone isomerase family protein [Chitinophagales bacterium]|nr:chalcone isomerase family protein [Chitinophagales bacterium]MDW8274435.1 chalcone isomerase family protein [Chitinophagales bacterium]
MKRSIIFLVFAFISATSFAQIKIADVTLPSTFKAGETELKYNGGGIRKKWFMDVYVAGLYLKAASKDGNAIAQANEPQNMRIAIISSLVTSERFIESTKEGFQKSTGGKTQPIQDKIDKFLKIFLKEPIVKGDVYDLTYIPNEGVKVYKNNKLADVVQGLDFKQALFGIWLGNNPADEKLKSGLLGAK